MEPKTRTILGFILLLVLLAAGVVLTWPSRSPHSDAFEVLIQNDSAHVLTNVELNGEGAWSQQVQDVPANGAVQVSIDQTFGESGLGIKFFADGSEVSKSGFAYVMANGKGATATVTVGSDLSVDAKFRDFMTFSFQ